MNGISLLMVVRYAAGGAIRGMAGLFLTYRVVESEDHQKTKGMSRQVFPL